MAIYRNEALIQGRQGRDKAGKAIPGKRVSIVAKAAYRAGQRLKDEQQEKTHQYQSRSQEVLYTEILAPENSPDWMKAEEEKHGGGALKDKQRALRERLWNTVERVEKRKDSQFAREFILAVPVELSDPEKIELVRNWCQNEIVRNGYVVDFSLHKSHDGKNPHAHVLQVLRPPDAKVPEGFGKKPDMTGKFNGRGNVGKAAKADLADWRQTWETAQNRALEKAGRTERVSHLSLKEQGLDQIPQPKIGPSANAMEHKGVLTERQEMVMWTKMDNLARPAMRGIERTGEVPQIGTGQTWWERAQVAIGRGVAHAGEFLRDESSGGRQFSQSDDSLRRSPTLDSAASWGDFITQQRNREQERGLPEPGS